MRTLEGVAASGGIAMGPVVLLEDRPPAPARQTAEDPAAEHRRLDDALQKARAQLEGLCKAAHATAGPEAAAIFEVHLMMLEDEEYLQGIYRAIDAQGLTAEYAVYENGRQFTQSMAAVDDETLRERAADFDDLAIRLRNILAGRGENPLAGKDGPAVVAARDLLPSQTVRLRREYVQAFLSEKGGPAGHAAILARSMGVPAVLGLGEGFAGIAAGAFVIVDGEAGRVIVNPDPATIAHYQALDDQRRQTLGKLQSLKGLPAQTVDGATIALCANINGPEEIDLALEQDAEGVGLFRSEFLWLGKASLAGEDAQFEIYKKVLHAMGPRRVVVRTLDIGADKQLVETDAEDNPALGLRGIRMSLAHRETFIPQLRALLRASVHGQLAILFPMVCDEKEVQEIFHLVGEVKADLQRAGIAYAGNIEYGIMIETPAAAIMADRLAPMVDFFSIGTNDLTQYTFAADRTNARVGHLYNPGSVAVLRMIRNVVRQAHHYNIRVCICGESAADTALLPHYIAMGVDELSMSPGALLGVKQAVRALSREGCAAQCEALLR